VIGLRTPVVVVLAALLNAALMAQGNAINNRGFLKPNESVPPLVGYALDGQKVTIDYRQEKLPTVVYVIDERGGAFVKANEANFAALVTQAAARYRFVVLCPVDTGDLRTYISSARPGWKGVPVSIVANVSDDLRQAMCLFAYPQTIVISTTGTVLENFQGAYGPASMNADRARVEAFFHIKLPGMP
jgi:hypothetical protein